MIPCFHGEGYSRQAIESVLAQSYSFIEVIVSDDGLSDSLRSFVGSRRYEDTRTIKYFSNIPPLGRLANYRALLHNYATGDYVVMLDGDDYFTDVHFISDAVKAFYDFPDLVIYASRVWRSDHRKPEAATKPKPVHTKGLGLLRELPAAQYFFAHMAAVYRRTLAIELDFYRDSSLSSDWESLYRLALTGRVLWSCDIVGVWRIHASNVSQCPDHNDSIACLAVWTRIFSEATLVGMSRPEAYGRRLIVQAFLFNGYLGQHFRQSPKSGLVFLKRVIQCQLDVFLVGCIATKVLPKAILGALGYFQFISQLVKRFK